jgi:type I restriction enzyme S subunit
MFNNEILFQTMGEGSTGQAELKRENIVRMPILIAPENVQEKFEVITSGHLGEFVLIEKQNYALHTLRDTLLPKLISGELRIKDAEKFIEALS